MTDRDDDPGRDGRDSVSIALEAGLALYNEGEYHAAHAPLESVWLGLDRDSDTARLLQGMIQLTAAVFHAQSRNWSGATGLASSGREYLEHPLEDRGVDVATARRYLDTVRVDPEVIERASPPRLSYRGTLPAAKSLSPGAVGPAAEALAEEYPRYDADAVADAIRYAGEQRGTGRTTFLSLLDDFVSNAADRDLIHQRLVGQVDLRRREDDDVEGLFE
jgi:Domain of unknown function (DUF309).